MKNNLLLTAILLLTSLGIVKSHPLKNITQTMSSIETPEDSARLAELDRYWVELSRTVKEGDYEGYKVAYHEDAVVIFASGKNKTSLPISTALAGWKQGFMDTESGKVSSNVAFRFSQRIGDPTTAHETGIFYYTSVDSNGKSTADFIVHFEMLLVKREGVWLGMMEYQKHEGTKEEWEALK